MVTESATQPQAGDANWNAPTPAGSGSFSGTYTFATAGVKTLYAWAKDAAGNVSNSVSAQVTITLPDTTAPVVSGLHAATDSDIPGRPLHHHGYR